MTAPKNRPCLADRIREGADKAMQRRVDGCRPCLADPYLMQLAEMPGKEAADTLRGWIADKTAPLRREIASFIAGRDQP